MNESGELVEWDDGRGFGFVRTAAGERLFLHISALPRGVSRPMLGDRLRFRRGPGRDGRPAVMAAQLAGMKVRAFDVQISSDRAARARAIRLLGATGLLTLLVMAGSLGRAPAWLAPAYVVMGAVSGVLYFFDKRAARAGGWRISETTLHSADLCFGIIGGLLAQTGLSHKTAKPGFGVATAVVCFVHVMGFATLLIS